MSIQPFAGKLLALKRGPFDVEKVPGSLEMFADTVYLILRSLSIDPQTLTNPTIQSSDSAIPALTFVSGPFPEIPPRLQGFQTVGGIRRGLGPANPRSPSNPRQQNQNEDPQKRGPDNTPVQIVAPVAGEPKTFQFTKNGLEPVGPDGKVIPSSGSGAGGGGVIPAIVTGGSGTAPTLNLYGDGVSVTQSVTGRVLQIASGESLPVGTYGYVSLVGGIYFFNPEGGVWL